MTIREELRAAAMTELPWYSLRSVAAKVADCFCDAGEPFIWKASAEHQSWFFLMVAEVL
jgi:hypothetical protein